MAMVTTTMSNNNKEKENSVNNNNNNSDKTKIAVVIRKDLPLSKGKWLAQVAHACFRAVGGRGANFNLARVRYDEKEGEEGKSLPVAVTFYVKNEAGLQKIITRCKEAGVGFGLQIDSGHNEVAKGTATCLVVGPASEETVNKVCKGLQTLKDE